VATSRSVNNPMALSSNVDTINLSLVSHTNVGKTTLLRTLIRRDIGEVADRAHVTEQAEGYVLIDTPQGDALRLWDTPGFGDSARLLKRLRGSDNPIGWLLTQVWDRFTDRPFFSSQQAIRNVRDESDVVLYLVNAAEDPSSAGYVDVEMQILGWIGKPVLLLLNQMGAPRAREVEAAEELIWRQHVASHTGVRGVIGLDAFARCWVQEDKLLGAVGDVLSPEKQTAFERLRGAWRAQNIEVFDAAMLALAAQLAAVATDRETVGVPSFKEKAGRWLRSMLTDREMTDPDTERAMNALAKRLDSAVRETTDRLIALYGLSGRASEGILARVAGQFGVTKPADVATSGMIGGAVTGALGGLAADLAAGGLTFGAGALIGGIVGALGASGAARAYNLARGAVDGRVGWSAAFLAQRPGAALLRYLAVAHYGRGRGEWVEGEYPPHWQQLTEEVTQRHRAGIESVWSLADEGASVDEVARLLQPIITAMARETLVRLYPEAERIFESTLQSCAASTGATLQSPDVAEDVPT
jgi:Domain of unknown function (DUF3482)/50S ribosome-binding GTPase